MIRTPDGRLFVSGDQKECIDATESVIRLALEEVIPGHIGLARELAVAGCIAWKELEPDPDERAVIEDMQGALDRLRKAYDRLPPSARGVVYTAWLHAPLTDLLDSLQGKSEAEVMAGMDRAGEELDVIKKTLFFNPGAVTAIEDMLRRLSKALDRSVEYWPRNPANRPENVETVLVFRLWAVLSKHGVSMRAASRVIARVFIDLGTVEANEDANKLSETLYQRIRNRARGK